MKSLWEKKKSITIVLHCIQFCSLHNIHFYPQEVSREEKKNLKANLKKKTYHWVLRGREIHVTHVFDKLAQECPFEPSYAFLTSFIYSTVYPFSHAGNLPTKYYNKILLLCSSNKKCICENSHITYELVIKTIWIQVSYAFVILQASQ